MVSSAPAGSGLPIGLMPGALPSDQASRQTLKTTAMRWPLGQTQFACCMCVHCSAGGTLLIAKFIVSGARRCMGSGEIGALEQEGCVEALGERVGQRNPPRFSLTLG